MLRMNESGLPLLRSRYFDQEQSIQQQHNYIVISSGVNIGDTSFKVTNLSNISSLLKKKIYGYQLLNPQYRFSPLGLRFYFLSYIQHLCGAQILKFLEVVFSSLLHEMICLSLLNIQYLKIIHFV